jgi:phage minor structural protein
MIKLYEKDATDFRNNGIGILSDCISAPVYRELNGKYELEIKYPIKDKKSLSAELVADRIIKCNTPSGDQLFRIVKTEKTLTQMYCYCQHISYDLQHCFAVNIHIQNETRLTGTQYLLDNMVSKNSKFTVTGDTTTELHSTTIKNKNGLQAILSTDATTILDTYGGEYDFDNFQIIARNQIGNDNGVLIAYRKNLTGITEILDYTDLATRIIPRKDDLYLDEVYIDSPYINNYSQIFTVELECSDATTQDDLREAVAAKYKTGCDLPFYNYKINFVQLSKTKEYENYKALEDVNIGDTVRIKHPDLNIDLSARVISYTYDVLLDKLITIELGKFAKKFNSTIKTLQATAKTNADNIIQTNSNLMNEIARATAAITGNSGGYVVLDPPENPQRILIMDDPDKNKARKCWQWNKEGLGYSSTGIDGEYGTAITANGHIVASFITGETIEGLKIIGAIIKSTNYVENSTGMIMDLIKSTIWTKNMQLDSDGTLTCVNGKFSGEITANSGTIGGFTITNKKLSAETSDTQKVGICSDPTQDWAIYSGAIIPNTDRHAFSVGHEGNVFCHDFWSDGANIVGGKIGNWSIDNAIYSNYDVPNTTERYTVYIQPYQADVGADTWIFAVDHSTDGGATGTGLMKIMGNGDVYTNDLYVNGNASISGTTWVKGVNVWGTINGTSGYYALKDYCIAAVNGTLA